MNITFIRDYLLECSKEHNWKEREFSLGYHQNTFGSLSSGAFVRNEFPMNEQTLNWTNRGDIVNLRKTSTDGLYYEQIFSISLCEPDSLEKIRAYFI
jgi:hypothetical protein